MAVGTIVVLLRDPDTAGGPVPIFELDATLPAEVTS